jgi:hypothetical protein
MPQERRGPGQQVGRDAGNALEPGTPAPAPRRAVLTSATFMKPLVHHRVTLLAKGAVLVGVMDILHDVLRVEQSLRA